MRKIISGVWRDDHDGPMQVVSGPVGKQTVHYEAPPAERITHAKWKHGGDGTFAYTSSPGLDSLGTGFNIAATALLGGTTVDIANLTPITTKTAPPTGNPK